MKEAPQVDGNTTFISKDFTAQPVRILHLVLWQDSIVAFDLIC